MQQATISALLNNAALLVILSIIFELTYQLFKRPIIKQVVNGLLIAVTCVAIMLVPFQLFPGIVFDTRTILISVTALNFGPITTIITIIPAIVVRILEGGVGVIPGVTGILGSALIGLLWRRWFETRAKKLRWYHVYGMGLAVHVMMIASLFLMPYPDSVNAFREIALPVMLIYPFATVLLCLLLTKQKTFWHMRDKLQQSEERFKMLFHCAPLAYQTMDINGSLTDVNEQWLDTFGYERDEVIGRSFLEFMDPASVEDYSKAFDQLKREGRVHRELEIRKKNGELLHISFDGSIEHDTRGASWQAYCILRDITEQKKAETEVRQSELKYRRLFENMAQGVVCQAADGTILWANPEAERILGLSFEQMLGKKSQDPNWRAIYEDGSEMPGSEHPSMVSLRTGKPCGPVVLGVFQPRLNSHVWISVNATPVLEPDGTLSQVYTIFQDVTAEKKAKQDYELLFNSMVDGFALHEIICDENGKPVDYRFLAVNPAFEQIIGKKASEIIGRTVLEVLPGTETYWIETYGKVALTGESVTFESYSGVTDKHFRVIAYQPAPMQFACTFSDDTSRVLAEAELFRTLARLRGLMNNSNSPIVVFDDKGVIAEVSAFAEKMTGLSRTELLGRSLEQLGLSDILKTALVHFNNPEWNGRIIENIDAYDYDGVRRYFESRLFPIATNQPNERLFGYLGVDVTGRMMAERALKESEEKYSSYIENAPYAVFVVDENGYYLESNKAASTIT